MFDKVTKVEASAELLSSFGAPLAQFVKVGDIVSFRRLEGERTDGATKFVDVLVNHSEKRGDCDAPAWMFDRHEGEVYEGDFFDHGDERLGAASFDGHRDEDGLVLNLP